MPADFARAQRAKVPHERAYPHVVVVLLFMGAARCVAADCSDHDDCSSCSDETERCGFAWADTCSCGWDGAAGECTRTERGAGCTSDSGESSTCSYNSPPGIGGCTDSLCTCPSGQVKHEYKQAGGPGTCWTCEDEVSFAENVGRAIGEKVLMPSVKACPVTRQCPVSEPGDDDVRAETWTEMQYWDADHNLEKYFVSHLNDLAKSISAPSSCVANYSNVVILIDRCHSKTSGCDHGVPTELVGIIDADGRPGALLCVPCLDRPRY
jgi:hypothetical protein